MTSLERLLPIGKSTQHGFIKVKGWEQISRKFHLRTRKHSCSVFLCKQKSENIFQCSVRNVSGDGIFFDIKKLISGRVLVLFCLLPSTYKAFATLVLNVEGQQSGRLPITSNSKIYSFFDGFISSHADRA